MVEIRWANLTEKDDVQEVVRLTNIYAADPNARGESLPDSILQSLPHFLSSTPGVMIAIAYLDGEAVGLATCITSISTFAAKPILNVHDIVVDEKARGQGIGSALLHAVESKAKALGCCKVSLEVADGNPAKELYERVGFCDSGTFMTKAIE